MKKHYIFYLLLTSLLVGCDNNETSPSESISESDSVIESLTSSPVESLEPTEEPSSEESSSVVEPSIEDSSSEDTPIEDTSTYATLNSENDMVFVYGIVGETFNLDRIDLSRLGNYKPTFSCDDDGVLINENTMLFNKVGIYDINITSGKRSLGAIKVLVNDSEENRYNYPLELDLSSYRQHSGSKYGKVEILENNEIKLVASGSESSDWNRITYSLDPSLSTNYTIECDVTLSDASANDRWFGLVFRSDSDTGFPYYQFDYRINSTLNKAVELTQVSNTGTYSYLYQNYWGDNNPGLITAEKTAHLKVEIKDYDAKCSIQVGDSLKEIDVKLPYISSGDFGFQCSFLTANIKNIKVTYDKDEVIRSFADTTESYVNIYDKNMVDSLKPHLLLSGASYGEHTVIYDDAQQIYAVVKDGVEIELYDTNDNLMDVGLNEMIRTSKGEYILNLQIDDVATAKKVLEIYKSFGLVDSVIWSANTDVLDYVHTSIPELRLGYIPTNVTSYETWDEIGAVCREAGRHYANMFLIDANLLNKENVHKTTGLGYTVVGNAKDGSNYSVLDAAMDGCTLILADVNIAVLEQATTLYHNGIISAASSYKSLLSSPYVTGHRGAGNTNSNPQAMDYPENSIASFKWALDHGADSVEIDIHTTKDNKLAVIHNGSTGDYANRNLTVANSTLAQLQELKLKANGKETEHRIPSMDELLDALNDPKYANASMVVEVKDLRAETGIAAIELCKEKGWYNRITIITFSAVAAKQIKDYDPGIQVAYLGDASRLTNEEYWEKTNSYLPLGVALASGYGSLSQESIQESNARGQINWLWTFNYGNNQQLINLINLGNKAFTTNYVGDFTNNDYKVVVDDITLASGETKTLSASTVSYVDEKTAIDNFEIIVLSDNATSNGTSITRTGEGDIYVIVKHKTTWNLYNYVQEYYIYSEVIKIS